MINGKNISFAYDKLSVLENISFNIKEGDFVAILGPNGAGKTTLIKLIMGLLPMQKGNLKINNIRVQEIKDKTLIGYMPQKYTIDKLFPGTVKEILDVQKDSDSEIISELGINDLLSKKFIELSGGQQQRVLITLAMQHKPKILILDEPTVGVDLKTEKAFLDLLKKINREKNITILLITHDVGMVPEIANKVLCINHSVCCMGPPSKSKSLLKKVYGHYQEHHHH